MIKKLNNYNKHQIFSYNNNYIWTHNQINNNNNCNLISYNNHNNQLKMLTNQFP
jgi:hypothetical protein